MKDLIESDKSSEEIVKNLTENDQNYLEAIGKELSNKMAYNIQNLDVVNNELDMMVTGQDGDYSIRGKKSGNKVEMQFRDFMSGEKLATISISSSGDAKKDAETISKDPKITSAL